LEAALVGRLGEADSGTICVSEVNPELLTWEDRNSWAESEFLVAETDVAQFVRGPVAVGVAENKKIPSTSL
jgi:hypothetical protein